MVAHIHNQLDEIHSKKNTTHSWNRLLFNRIPVLLFYSFWFLFGILVLRKTQNAIAAVRYVKTYGDSVSIASIEKSVEFNHLIHTLDKHFNRPPAFLLLNQYALNMTYNFLCNTASLEGVHERLIFVTLDTVSRDELRKNWPNIRQFHWPTPSLYKPFSFAEGPYQTIYLLRANIAVALLKKGKSFWMMQQDTFWRKNIFQLGFEDDMSYDALFDQIGIDEDSMRAEWVNGANFFVRANNDTQLFFERVADKLAHWYTPDMGIMIHQCHTWNKPKCAYIPHKIAHSWEWMYTKQQDAPYIMQLDCETDGGSKLMQLGRFGFHFIESNGTCNHQKVELARQRMETGGIEVSRAFPSWGRLQFKAYWFIVDYILWTPIIGPLLKPFLPLVGYILMITILKNSDGKWISRLYTPTSITNHYFEVPIKIYNNGRMSKLWKNIEEGMNIEWMGPYNHQYLWQKLESDILLVAGGTGIAAFYRLIQSWISDDNSEFRIRIVICVHSKQHIIFAKEMASWAENWNISIIIYCSKATTEDIFLPYHLKTKESRLTEEEFNQNFDTLANNGSSSTMVAVCACRSLSKDIVKFCMKRNIEENRIIRFPT